MTELPAWQLSPGQWQHLDGREPSWTRRGDVLVVEPGRGDLVSRTVFGDGVYWLEFCLPDMPHAQGQDKANSGVFIQGLYEIQILDSAHLRQPGTGDCGAIYEQHAPLTNACLPAGQWQQLEVVFRAARGPTEPARLTAWLNQQLIHNNAQLTGPTRGALQRPMEEPGPIRLQDHGAPVGFRNIRVQPLPPGGLSAYHGN